MSAIDLFDGRVEVNRHPSAGLARQHFLRQDLVRARDLRSANDETDAIVIGQRDGNFERRITGADHEDVLILMLRGIDETSANMRQLFARRAEFARIALCSHRQDHVLRFEHLCGARLDHETIAFAFERLHFGVERDIQLLLDRMALPRIENRFTRAGLKRQIAARRDEHRLRHHVLARLIVVDRVGEMIGTFEQHVRHRIVVRVRGGGETSRAGADDDEVVDHHFSSGFVISPAFVSVATLNVRITRPKRTTSLSSRIRLSVTRSPFTNVPLRLFKSSMTNPSAVRATRACFDDTLTSASTIVFAESRPIRYSLSSSG